MSQAQELQGQLLGKAAELGQYAMRLPYNREFLREFTTNEDFSRQCPELQRLVVIGCTGAGKSTLCNKLAGFRYEWDEELSQFVWTSGQEKLLFACSQGANSVTDHTTYANLPYLGRMDRPFVCIDTPGHNDTGTDDTLLRQATDLHTKLRRMGHVNAILVLHNDVWSGRFSPTTQELMAKVQEMFKASGRNVWEHVIIGFSRCDEADRGWRGSIEEKSRDLQAALRTRFDDCNVDVPVVPLSGADEPGAGPSQAASFERLWEFLEGRPKLPTVELREFEGMSLQLKRAVKERDNAQRLASARKTFLEAGIHVFLGSLALNYRPSLINATGPWDELLLAGGFIYVMGPVKMYDFFRVAWDDHLLPRFDSALGDKLRQNGIDPAEFRMIEDDAARKRRGNDVGGGATKRRRLGEEGEAQLGSPVCGGA